MRFFPTKIDLEDFEVPLDLNASIYLTEDIKDVVNMNNPSEMEDAIKMEDEDISIKTEKYDDNIYMHLNIMPIVYTTRLDDMQICRKKLKKKSLKEITNCIISESHPKFISCIRTTLKQYKSVESFNRLQEKLIEINKKTKYKSSYQRNNAMNVVEPVLSSNVKKVNKELLKQCKPLRVVVKDIMYPKNDGSEDAVITGVIKKPEILSPRKKIRIPSDNRHTIFALEEMEYNGNCYYFVVKDYSRYEIDVYLIENGNLSGYNRLSNIKDMDHTNILSYVNHKKTKVVGICCWYQRENIIDSMQAKQSAKTFMKKPHTCKFDKCNCCCRPLNDCAKDKKEEAIDFLPGEETVNIDSQISCENKPDPNIIEDIEITSLEKELSQTFYQITSKISCDYNKKTQNWLKDLHKKTTFGTLIAKALSYTRPLAQPKATPNNLTKNGSALVCHDRNLLQVELLIEDTKTTTYCKKDECFSSIEQGQRLFQSEINCNQLDQIKEVSFCCWMSREEKIDNIYTILQNPSLAKFLKIPHNCPRKNCTCCCKQRTKHTVARIPTDKTYTRLPSTHDTVIISDDETDSIETNSIKTEIIIDEIESATEPFKTEIIIEQMETEPIKTESIDDLPDMCPTSQTAKTSPHTSDSGKIKTRLHKVPVSDVPVHILPKPQLQTKLRVQPKPITRQTATVDSVVGSMITTILDRFKDVRLTINEHGKVAAALNAPANSLSTAELKILANILNHAQEQVKALGLAPGCTISATDLQNSIDNLKTPSMQTEYFEMQTQNNPSNTPGPSSNSIHMQSFLKETEISTASTNSTHNLRPQENEQGTSMDKKSLRILETMSSLNHDMGQSLMTSFQLYVSSNEDTSIPKITNVFSLNPENSEKKCASQIKKDEVPNKSANKRKSNDPPAPAPGKIRVVCPSKLGIKTTSNGSINDSSDPTDEPATSICVNSNTPPPLTYLPKISNVEGNVQTTPKTIIAYSKISDPSGNMAVLHPISQPDTFQVVGPSSQTAVAASVYRIANLETVKDSKCVKLVPVTLPQNTTPRPALASTPTYLKIVPGPPPVNPP